MPLITGLDIDNFRCFEKLRVEGLDNHWLDGLVGAAVAASMQGAVLFGTDLKQAVRPRLRLSALKGAQR